MTGETGSAARALEEPIYLQLLAWKKVFNLVVVGIPTLFMIILNTKTGGREFE
jgi:hypothetical protein